MISEGCEVLPSPEELFALVENNRESAGELESEASDESWVSAHEVSESYSHVVIEDDEGYQSFKLPKTNCLYQSKFEVLLTVIEITELPSLASETSSVTLEFPATETSGSLEEESCSSEEYTKFYQPDLNIHSRFLPLTESSDSVEETNDQSHESIITPTQADESCTNKHNLVLVQLKHDNKFFKACLKKKVLVFYFQEQLQHQKGC